MFDRIKQYLPSKKFSLTVLSGIGIIALVLLAKQFIHRDTTGAIKLGSKSVNPVENSSLVSINTIVESDRDNDGVADWEESLWGTDPNKTDTDSDGISDAEEIAAKKNSLSSASNTETDDLTETEAFSRELFISISALKESGNLTADTISDLAKTIGENAGEEQVIIDTYNQADLTIVPATPESRKAYHTKMLATFKKYDDSDIGNELVSIDTSLASEDEAELATLGPIATAYRNFAKDLASVSVPADIAATHLAFMNGAQNTSVALGSILLIYDNSIVGLIGLSQYETESSRFDEGLIDLQSYFVKNGIL